MAPSIASAFVALSLALSAVAQRVLPSQYIVEFEGRGLSKRSDGFADAHAAFHHHAKRADIGYLVAHEYKSDLFSGIAIAIDDEADLDALRKLPGVHAVIPDREVPPPSGATAPIVHGKNIKRAIDRNDTFVPHVMTKIDKVHASGITGAGVTVCVIDTGLDYTHPALGGAYGPGYKVLGGRNYADDQPANDFMDCYGHGTHVAGTVAANRDSLGFIGAAPDANLRSYRVFGCSNGAADSIIIAAMLDAASDGCNVITMSLGGPSGWSTGASATIASRIVAERNIPMTMSMGNEGSDGMFYAGSVSAGTDVMAVASIDTPELVGWKATTSTGREIVYQTANSFGAAPGSGGAAMSGQVPFKVLGTSYDDPATYGCEPYSGPDLSNSVVIIRGGGPCPIGAGGKAGILKGHAKFMFYVRNPTSPPEYRDIDTYAPTSGIFIATISDDDARYLVEQLLAGVPLTASFAHDTVVIPNTYSPGMTSIFSSFGPNWLLDASEASVAAPGGHILSTWPMKLGQYATISGTSMATPLMAGSVALYMSAKKANAAAIDPARIKDVFANTAVPTRHPLYPDMLDVVSHSGAGLIDVECAVTTDMVASPAQIYLGDQEYFGSSRRITVTNYGQHTRTYRIRHEAAPLARSINTTGDWYNTPQFQSGAAKISFSTNTLEVPAGESRQVVASFTPPNVDGFADQFPVYSGFIHFSSNSTCEPQVSYHGVAAKMIDMTILRKPLTIYRHEVPQLPGDNVYDPNVPGDNAGFVPFYSAGVPYFKIDVVTAESVVPPGVKVSSTPLHRRNSDLHAGRPVNHGQKPRRALRPRQDPVDPSTGNGVDGEQAEEDYRIAKSIADMRVAMNKVFAPYTSTFKVVGAFAGAETVNAPRSPASKLGDQRQAYQVPFEVVDEEGKSRNLPDGSYRLAIRARRIFGDANSLEGYEAILSDVYTIKRGAH